jgi:dephospho-CoA kinase
MNKIMVGLTGGICMGKSTVSKTFIENGIPVVDADIVARQLVVPGTDLLKLIIKEFGQNFLTEDATLNRKALSDHIFSSFEARMELDKIMLHPIMTECQRQLDNLLSQNPIVVFDAALIIECGILQMFNSLVVVSCKHETQIQRLMSRNSLSGNQAMQRINAQVNSKVRKSFADYEINTDGAIESSIAQTNLIIRRLRSGKI